MFSGHSIPVAQLGPDFLLLDAPADHPPGPASILLRVDQSERRWDVRLPNGISATSKRVNASRLADGEMINHYYRLGRICAAHDIGVPDEERF